MTMSYVLDLSKSLTDNIKVINDLVFGEMQQFDHSDSPHIQQRLEINVTDFYLLTMMRNAFKVSGMDMIKKFHPELSLVLKGNYDASCVSTKLAEWKNHPSHLAAEDTLRQIAKWRLQAKGLIK